MRFELPSAGRGVLREVQLLVAREVLTREVKCLLAHAPGVATKDVLCVAYSRWHIERLFEYGKGEVGFDHFEGRMQHARLWPRDRPMQGAAPTSYHRTTMARPVATRRPSASVTRRKYRPGARVCAGRTQAP